MYESVYAWPNGRSTVRRFAATAARYGFEGIVVRRHADAQPSDPSMSDLYDQSDSFDVVAGVEIRGETPAAVSGTLGTYRRRFPVVCLHGGTDRMNRFGVEQERLDVLAHPLRGGGRVNHVLARSAVENDVRLEVNLGPVITAQGGQRVRALDALDSLRTVIDQYDAPYVVSATPDRHLSLRAPRALVAVGETIGFEGSWIENGLAEWGRIVAHNRRVESDEFVEPGVEILPDGDPADESSGRSAPTDAGTEREQEDP